MKNVLGVLMFLFGSVSVYSQNVDYSVITVEFRTDTARIEQQVDNMVDQNPTTLGLIEASDFSEREYDKLLNKYYNVLYNALNEDGKKALKETQLSWIKFRDSDKELIRQMNVQVYDEMGGGTIWSVVASDARADVTRRRVIELFNYIMFADIGG